MAMAENEKGDTASSEEGEVWGTLEELLLACAISRHGIESWDSISLEVQKRANPGHRDNQRRNKDGDNFENNFSNAFTPQNCEHKYHALKRRFNVTGGGERNGSSAVDEDAGGGRGLREKLSFMVDELRKLRVEELRRQVERHDVSIVSLQLKVKKLEDAREKSSSKAEPEVGGVDLGKRADRSDADERRVIGSAEVAGKSDEPEDGSFNESNSTSHKGGPFGSGGLNQSREPDPVLPVADSAPDKGCSSSRGDDGGRDLEKEKVVVGTSPPNRLGNSGELRESVSESKREGKESKQSSDVQSSASLSRRKRRGWRRGDGIGSSGDEMETEERSPANKGKGIKSQPLIRFFEIVRSHKHGLVFQRRLPSQETEKYRNLIRQHMDLETVQSKLDRGVYSDCHLKFYRDILLIFSNAILFFCKSSTENAAARELRKLVMKEIVSQQVARKPKAALPVKPNLESQIDPVVKKPRSSTNIVVCRRRTNSSAKSKELEEVKVESLDTKPSVNMKDNGKNDESSDEEEQPINKRRKKLVRKQGVVNFLKRMQQNSPSKEAVVKPNDDTEEELQEERTKKAEIGKKKVVAGKNKHRDDGAVNRRVLGRRSTKGDEVENLETMRRGGGRPSARKAAMGGSGGGTPDSGRLKRRRDGEKEAAGSSGKNTSTAKKSRR